MYARKDYYVLNKIQAMLAESEDGLEIRKKVFNFILQSKAYFRDRCVIHNIIKALAQNFLIYGCDDSDIVSRIFHMYRRWIEGWIEMDDATVNYILKPLDFINYQLNVYHSIEDDSFLPAVDMGDLYMVKLCIKYGKISRGSLLSHRDYFLPEFKHFIKRCMFHQNKCQYEAEWAENFLEAMYYTRGKIRNTQRGIQRIYTLLYVLFRLHYIISNKKNYSADHIQCLKMYFNVINKPFIAQDEIRDFLKLIFANEENYEDVVEEIINIYRGMFPPEVTLVYEPRTLKHQSRCAVREYLRYQTESITLPKLISQQNVPPIIKELLLGAPEFSS